MKILLAFIFIGGWALIAVFINWPLGIEYKISLLRSILIASTALVGFSIIFLIKVIRDYEILVKEFRVSDKRMKNCRIFLSWSIIIGCIAILVVLFYFITYEISLISAAWILFVLQLELFIFPLIFTKIIVFR
jgi:hypothetical protein